MCGDSLPLCLSIAPDESSFVVGMEDDASVMRFAVPEQLYDETMENERMKPLKVLPVSHFESEFWHKSSVDDVHFLSDSLVCKYSYLLFILI
jgi:hypothetical protein